MKKINKTNSLVYKKILYSVAEILRQESFLKYKIVFSFIIIISLLAELLVFNFRAVESAFNREAKISGYTINYAKSLGDGSFISAGDGVVRDSENNSFTAALTDFKRLDDGTYAVSANAVIQNENNNTFTIVTPNAVKNNDGSYSIVDRDYIEENNLDSYSIISVNARHQEDGSYSAFYLDTADVGSSIYTKITPNAGSPAAKNDETVSGTERTKQNDNIYMIHDLRTNKNEGFAMLVSDIFKNENGTFSLSDSIIYIEAGNVNHTLKNIKADIQRSVGSGYTSIRLWTVDESNRLGIFAPEREISDELPVSKYIRTHFNGNVKKLRIYIKTTPGEIIGINDLKLNTRVPLYFSAERFLFMIFALMLLFILRPKSFIYKHPLNFNCKWQKWSAAAVLATELILILSLCHIDPQYISPQWQAHKQYQELADSFLSGHTYLVSKQPSEELMAMENPYDTELRNKLGVRYEWDNAYRNGHYYVYFGIVPELIFFLPFKAISGIDFPNHTAVFICCAAMCLAVMLLLYLTAKKWFDKVSFGIYILMCLIMTISCGAIYISKRPDFYSIPIAAAMALAALGVSFWLLAERKNQSDISAFSSKYLCIGSICSSLVAGCRPHILIVSVFGAILLWKPIFKDRTLFSRRSIAETAALCLPYIITAAAIMFYNYIRFKSPFDFGSNYNITTNDITRRGIEADRNLAAIFYYLLQPLTVTNQFPYIQMVNVYTQYQGLTIAERMAGGLLWLSPVTLFAVRGLFNAKWHTTDKRPYILIWASVFSAAIIVLLDGQVAGILTRYYSDFSWILLFGAAIAVFAEYNLIDSEAEKQKFIYIILVCFVISAAAYGLHIFNDVDNSLLYGNPRLYYKMKYLIGFLL